MKMLIILLIMSFANVTYFDVKMAVAGDESTEMLGDAVLGGLLGAGVGAAIGSASGEAGKGAGVGAGVGALSGALLGTVRRSSTRSSEYDDGSYYGRDRYRHTPRYSYRNGKFRPGVRRKIIREYDDDGYVISEKEVYYDRREE